MHEICRKFSHVVTIERLNRATGTMKSGQFRGCGQFRGVVNLEGCNLLINKREKIRDREKWSLYCRWSV